MSMGSELGPAAFSIWPRLFRSFIAIVSAHSIGKLLLLEDATQSLKRTPHSFIKPEVKPWSVGGIPNGEDIAAAIQADNF